MTLWMMVDTKHPAQLPLAVAESCTELAKMTGTTRVNILSNIYHAKERDAKKQKFLKIEIDD